MSKATPTQMAVSAMMGIIAVLWFANVIFGINVFDSLGAELGAVAVTLIVAISGYDVLKTFGIIDCY